MKTKIDISLCPTSMERDGDILDESAVEAMIQRACEAHYPGMSWSFQIGYNQGDEWYTVDGKDSDELHDLVGELDWSNESLYEEATE